MGLVRVGYIRTSKKDQNPELQRRDLLTAGCEKVFEEQISSRKADRPELRAALEYVREGDAFALPHGARTRTGLPAYCCDSNLNEMFRRTRKLLT